MEFKVDRLTIGPKHHLFGFHDLVQTNAKGDLALSLEIDDISHPPLPGDCCRFGIVPASGGDFVALGETHTWNYPQGARQQWIGDSDLFTCNDRGDDGDVFAWVSDARSRRRIDRLSFPVHCINAEDGVAFWFDYDRVHACGGYGYHPLNNGRAYRLTDIPDDDGIWSGDLKSGGKRLLVSIRQVAMCGAACPVRTGYPHYLTHLMLNPSGRRIAFLHRYRLVDGGETTRLMTMGIDGTGLRCLAKGFLSHFTWISDNEIFIWGAHQPQLYSLREASWLRIPGLVQCVMLAKRGVKILRSIKGANVSGAKAAGQDKSFLVISDKEEVSIEKVAVRVLVEDGHPMANPRNRQFLINDTYPDSDGVRTLMTYDVKSNERCDIGRFPMINDKPDISKFDCQSAQAGFDFRIKRKFSRDLYLFTRSGFHCDLHPRWSYDGEVAYFDSIHEGTRQIYKVEIG